VRGTRKEIEVSFKKLVRVVALCLSALSLHVAMAHGGAHASHGVVVATASDPGFALVSTSTGATICIDDPGKPMAPTGLKGRLTVLNGAQKSESDLVLVGDKLEAQGLKLAKGSKAVASLVTPAAQAITVRFTVQ